MLKSYINILRKILSWKIISATVLLFLSVALMPFKFVPDYFRLGRLAGKKDIIFRLLTTTVGFSGMLLTVLLVVYNFYIKTVRRNTLDFIIDNLWIRRIFSLFFGNIIFLSLGFFIIEMSSVINDLTILYFSYYLTVLLILSLFPLTILALNDSVSLKRIDKLIASITDKHIIQLYQSPLRTDITLIHKVEGNPILLLREIATNAISERDWVLPQTILSKIFTLLIDPLDKKSDEFKFQSHLSVWILFCNGVKNTAFKNTDQTTATALLKLNLSAHQHMAAKGMILVRGNEIDDFLKDLLRLIIENNMLFQHQGHFVRFTTDILLSHFESLHYSDSELPTKEFYYQQLEQKQTIDHEFTPLTNYWFYLTHELPELIFDTIKYAIDSNRKRVFDHFSWNIQHLVDAIMANEHLTTSQKHEAVEELSFGADRLAEYAIDHNIFTGIDVVSHSQIERWFLKDARMGFVGLYRFQRMIRLLLKKSALSSTYVDNLFMIARVLSNKDVEGTICQEVVSSILDFVLAILSRGSCDPDTKSNFLYELKWFYESYLTVNQKLIQLSGKYEHQIKSILENYDIKRYFTP